MIDDHRGETEAHFIDDQQDFGACHQRAAEARTSVARRPTDCRPIARTLLGERRERLISNLRRNLRARLIPAFAADESRPCANSLRPSCSREKACRPSGTCTRPERKDLLGPQRKPRSCPAETVMTSRRDQPSAKCRAQQGRLAGTVRADQSPRSRPAPPRKPTSNNTGAAPVAGAVRPLRPRATISLMRVACRDRLRSPARR